MFNIYSLYYYKVKYAKQFKSIPINIVLAHKNYQMITKYFLGDYSFLIKLQQT